uniref:5-hydroxytryptamine (serotonin) receptor 2C, G protein-coupled-like 2 n=1 Tax=Cyprinus carpio TaxID=7962 RepID=A0A8C2HW97_CYPCA
MKILLFLTLKVCHSFPFQIWLPFYMLLIRYYIVYLFIEHTVLLSLPIPVMGFQDKKKVFVNDTCTLNEPRFVLVGSSVAFFVPLVIMVVCYYLTLRVLQRHSTSFPQESRRYSKHSSAGISDTSLLNRKSSSSKSAQGPQGQSRRGTFQSLNNERRASKVLGIVFFLFLVMWCPFFITNVLIAICQDNCSEHLYNLIHFFVWVGYISSGVNPLIYTLFNETYRQAFKKAQAIRNIDTV